MGINSKGFLPFGISFFRSEGINPKDSKSRGCSSALTGNTIPKKSKVIAIFLSIFLITPIY
jgi:hypothetical protein